jgi:hypothetical protein
MDSDMMLLTRRHSATLYMIITYGAIVDGHCIEHTCSGQATDPPSSFLPYGSPYATTTVAPPKCIISGTSKRRHEQNLAVGGEL